MHYIIHLISRAYNLYTLRLNVDEIVQPIGYATNDVWSGSRTNVNSDTLLWYISFSSKYPRLTEQTVKIIIFST